MTDDELRAVVADLPDGDGLLRVLHGYVAKARPSAASAEAAQTDLETLDAWVSAAGGQTRTARVASSAARRPGHRSPQPPSAPQRFYVIPLAALAE